MKKYVKIIQPNKTIYFKNRKVRTPATLEVTDSDLKSLIVVFKMADIQDFEIVTKTPEIKKQLEVEIFDFDENKKPIIEELNLEELEEYEYPKTILEKFMRNGEEE